VKEGCSIRTTHSRKKARVHEQGAIWTGIISAVNSGQPTHSKAFTLHVVVDLLVLSGRFRREPGAVATDKNFTKNQHITTHNCQPTPREAMSLGNIQDDRFRSMFELQYHDVETLV
jgi:hypothetical protein